MTERPLNSFANDLRDALNAWRLVPSIVVVTSLIAIAMYVVPLTGDDVVEGCAGAFDARCSPTAVQALTDVAQFVVFLFIAGWSGASRVVYLRAWRGQRTKARDEWRLTGRFMWRYCKLGILMAAAALIVVSTMLLLPRDMRVAATVTSLMALFASLAFVTPSLAYANVRVRSALREGFGLIGRTWPRSASYLFVPLVWTLTSVLVQNQGRHAERFAVVLLPVFGLVLGLVELAFVGATARFYLRETRTEETTGEYGAAYLRPDPEVKPRCANGHEVGLLDLYCRTCGAEVALNAR